MISGHQSTANFLDIRSDIYNRDTCATDINIVLLALLLLLIEVSYTTHHSTLLIIIYLPSVVWFHSVGGYF